MLPTDLREQLEQMRVSGALFSLLLLDQQAVAHAY